jgi:ornithine cyclodeaminase/alanine dehydrogenase-like protein (mu-crystallin family)
MQVLLINQSDVPQLLPMRECMEVMADALKSLARGEVILPLRPVLWLPEKVGALGMMPAYSCAPCNYAIAANGSLRAG